MKRRLRLVKPAAMEQSSGHASGGRGKLEVWRGRAAGNGSRHHGLTMEVPLDVANARALVLGGAAAVRRAGLPTLHGWFV